MSTAGQYRKKPIVIEAVPVGEALRAAGNDWADLPNWLRDAYEGGTVTFASDAIFINTLEGQMCASKADFLIQGVQGELYPCKPDIFQATYEVVSAMSDAITESTAGARAMQAAFDEVAQSSRELQAAVERMSRLPWAKPERTPCEHCGVTEVPHDIKCPSLIREAPAVL